MTTSREHMLADMQWLFAQDGEEVRDVVIDGETVRAIVHEEEAIAGPVEGSTRRRISLHLLKETITQLPRSGFEMEIDGGKWLVESVDPMGILDIIILEQYS
jgi:hypothetical protein